MRALRLECCMSRGSNAMNAHRLDPASGRWWLRVDGDRLTLTLAGRVTAKVAAEAVEEVAATVIEHGRVVVVVADILEVLGFDPAAPVAAIRAALPARHLISGVELVVRHRALQIASLAAAHVLGLPCTVRHERPVGLRSLQG
jgi:hypothetical protein